jgi:UDPglucose--hexose-1-phosphate uridylyltransferase
MAAFQLKSHTHRRYNPLTREWILVSPHRTQRPWLGKQDKESAQSRVSYDPNCYLCPGNTRVGGERNPSYSSTFVFDNDFPALMAKVPRGRLDHDGLIAARAERGRCRVLCFSPRHDLDLPLMETTELRQVVDIWAEQYRELGSIPGIRHVQIFENRGEMMGASNPHPHCQIWANETLPMEVTKEQRAFSAYKRGRGACLICRYLELEAQARERIVLENDDFLTLVPFWAVWPFETMVVSKHHRAGMDELNEREKDSLADILRRTTIRYDNLFSTAFPYSMGFHQRPTDGKPHAEWHLHAHFYPPLLRSATVRKFMVGYELLANPQRDITAESAAERLRELSDRHYCREIQA